jgi:hemerythrin superfamily protein
MSNVTPTAEPADGLELLAQDHRRFEALYVRLSSNGDADDRRHAATELVRGLSQHAIAEELLVYPLARHALADGDGAADHSLEEHQTIKDWLHEADGTDPDDPSFVERFARVLEVVRQHVEEEEGQLFPSLRAAVDHQELVALRDRLDEAKSAAPTHPHPHAPNTPPGNVVAGPLATAVDKVRDAVTKG